MVDTTLDMHVEMMRNIQSFGNNHLIFSVIVASFGEDKTIFVSLDIINPEVEAH